MNSRTKGILFVAILSLCVVLYLLLPNFPPLYELVWSFNIFQHDQQSFILLMIFFVFIAYILTELAVYAYRFTAKIRWQTPKIGKILVSQGYITQDELFQALTEQSFKIGEILVQEGRITPQQLANALKYQHEKYGRLGEILIELGYSKDEDIRWALKKINRKLGYILCDKKLLTEYDMACALSLKEYRIDNHGRIDTKE